MLDKFKQLRELKRLQDELSKEKVEVEKRGIRLVLNGKIEVEEIVLNPELSQNDQEAILKDCINEAVKKMQFKLAQKMQQMPGTGF